MSFSNHATRFSQTNDCCILEDLLDQGPDDSLSKRNNLKTETPDILKNIIDDLAFELKTSLSNIMLASELFERGFTTEQDMFVEIIQRNSKRISSVISNLNMVSIHRKSNL